MFFWFLFLVVYSYFWPAGLNIAANMAGIIELICQTPLFWLSLLMAPLLALTPDIVSQAAFVTIKPSESDLVKMAEKGHYNPTPYMDKITKIGKEAKALIRRGKSRSPAETTEMASAAASRPSSNAGLGYAFSQEEGGVRSQNEMVKMYEERPKAKAERYEGHDHDRRRGNTDKVNSLGM